MGLIMPIIPLGNFGNVMPQAQAGRVLDTGAGYIGQAVNQLGQVGQQVSAKKLNEAQKIQDEKDEYFFNTQAAKYGADYTDVVTDTKNKLVTGEFNEASAKDYLRQKTDQLAETYRATLPNTKHDKFNYYTEKMFFDSEAHVKPLAYETERRAINADFEQVGEATLKITDRSQAEALFKNTVERNPVLTPEQRTKSLEEWNQRRDLTDGKGVLNNLETASDIEGLIKVRDNVDTIFPHLKVETRDAYKGQIDSAIDRINRAKEIAQTKANNEAKQLANDFRTDAYTGYPISAERTEAVLARVAGTEYEAQVREDLALNKEAQAFKKLSPLEQERRINEIRVSAENSPQSDASLLEKRLNMFQGIANATKSRIEKDPMASLPNVAHVSPEALGTGKIDFKKAQLATQMLAEQKRKNGGQGSLLQWNDSERKYVIKRYYESTPQQQKAMLSDMANMFGDNKEAQLEAFKLISTNHPHDFIGITQLAKIGAYVKEPHADVADMIIEGKHLQQIGEDRLLGNITEFNKIVSPEFGNTTTVGQTEYRSYLNMAYSAYVGMIKRNPSRLQVDQNGKPLIDTALAIKMFNGVTGGTYKQKFGKNTNAVFMPHGYSETTFRDYFENYERTQFKKDTGIVYDMNILDDYAIRQVAGKAYTYQFVQPNGVVLNNPRTGKAVQVTLPLRQ